MKTVIDCGIPLDVRYGGYKLLNSTTSYQSIVKYHCHENYSLIGNETRNCTETASWSGLEPTCKREYNYSFYLLLFIPLGFLDLHYPLCNATCKSLQLRLICLFYFCKSSSVNPFLCYSWISFVPVYLSCRHWPAAIQYSLCHVSVSDLQLGSTLDLSLFVRHLEREKKKKVEGNSVLSLLMIVVSCQSDNYFFPGLLTLAWVGWWCH